MNLRTATNELHQPPRISVNNLMLQAVGMVTLAYILASVAG